MGLKDFKCSKDKKSEMNFAHGVKFDSTILN